MSSLPATVAASACTKPEETCIICTKPVVGLTWITRGNYKLEQRVATCDGCFQEEGSPFEPHVAKFMRTCCVPDGLEAIFARMESNNRPVFRLQDTSSLDEYERSEDIYNEDNEPIPCYWPIRKTKTTAALVLQDPITFGSSSMRCETLVPKSKWRLWLLCRKVRMHNGISCVTLRIERSEQIENPMIRLPIPLKRSANREVKAEDTPGTSTSNTTSKRPRMDSNEAQGSSCVVCLVSPLDTLCMPCCHLCLCSGCSKKLTKVCPMCRSKVTRFKHVFLP